MTNSKDKLLKIIIYCVLFFATAAIIYYNMVISPQYPMVYSQYNQSILYLIGRMIKSGKLPYIDVIDHKGIYVLLIHYLATLIGENNHIGLYIIGVLFNFISVIYIYKIIIAISIEELKTNEKKNITQNKNDGKMFIIEITAIFSSLLYVVLQSLYTISYGTLQSESFITTIIVASIYYFIKDIIDNKYKYKHTFIYGVLFSFILFVKPNYNLFYVAIAVLILINSIKENVLNTISHHIAYGVIGIIAGALPAIIYALVNNNLKEMFYYTFIVNAIYSSAPYIGLNTKIESVLWTLSQFIHIYVIVLVGLIILVVISTKLYDNKKVKSIYISLTFIAFLLIISTLVSARNYSYYLLVLIPFIIMIMYEILKSIFSLTLRLNLVKYIIVSVLIILLTAFSINLSLKYGRDLMIKNGKDNLKVASFVKETYKNNVYGNRKNLLVLGSELYLYDYIGVLPTFKYFAVPMIGYKYYSEPYLETIQYIKSRKADILVLGLGAGLSEFYNNTNLVDAINSNYSLLSNTFGRQVFKLK